jgi:hypothetical protein
LNKIIQVGDGFERPVDLVHGGGRVLSRHRQAPALAECFLEILQSFVRENSLIQDAPPALAGEDAINGHRVRGGKLLLGPVVCLHRRFSVDMTRVTNVRYQTLRWQRNGKRCQFAEKIAARDPLEKDCLSVAGLNEKI